MTIELSPPERLVEAYLEMDREQLLDVIETRHGDRIRTRHGTVASFRHLDRSELAEELAFDDVHGTEPVTEPVTRDGTGHR